MQEKMINREKLLIFGTSLSGSEVFDLIEDLDRYDINKFVENWDRKKQINLFVTDLSFGLMMLHRWP